MKQYLTIKNILFTVLLIGFMILLITLFRGRYWGGDNNSEIQAKDSIIAFYKIQIQQAQKEVDAKNTIIKTYQLRDSILQVHSDELEKQYNDISKSLKNVSNRISKLATDDSSLIAAFNGYQPIR